MKGCCPDWGKAVGTFSIFSNYTACTAKSHSQGWYLNTGNESETKRRHTELDSFTNSRPCPMICTNPFSVPIILQFPVFNLHTKLHPDTFLAHAHVQMQSLQSFGNVSSVLCSVYFHTASILKIVGGLWHSAQPPQLSISYQLPHTKRSTLKPPLQPWSATCSEDNSFILVISMWGGSTVRLLILPLWCGNTVCLFAWPVCYVSRFKSQLSSFLSVVSDSPSLSYPHISPCFSDSSRAPPHLAPDDRYW